MDKCGCVEVTGRGKNKSKCALLTVPHAPALQHPEPTGLLPPNSHWPQRIQFTKHSSLTLTKFSFIHSTRKPWTRSNLNLITPFQSVFPYIGKKPSKIAKSSRKSHPLLEFVVSKACAKLLEQLWCTSLPWELPGHQLINHTWVLDTAHLPLLEQNNGDTEFLLSTHLQAGCSKPSCFPWGLKSSLQQELNI